MILQTEEVLAPIALTPAELRLKLLYTMAETYKTLGFHTIKANCVGYETPAQIEGRFKNHVPDLTCVQNTKTRHGLILQIVLSRDFKDTAEFLSRAELFADAARMYRHDFHIAIPTMKLNGEWLERQIRSHLSLKGILPNKIWSL